MSTYQIVDGHDNAGTLAAFDPQPKSSPIRYPETVYTPSGAYPNGYAYQDLAWACATRAQYNSILTACGLSDTVYFNEVTVKTKKNDDTFANYNATVQYEPPGERGFGFWRDLVVRLINLEAL